MGIKKKKNEQTADQPVETRPSRPWTLRDLLNFLNQQPGAFLDQPTGLYLSYGGPLTGGAFHYEGEHPGPIKYVVKWKYR